MKDLGIIGSGVGGLGAGLYAARYQLETEIIGDFLGGETTTAWTVENYLGFESIDGYDLVARSKNQVESLGVRLINDEVKKIEKIEEGFRLTTESGETLEYRAIILASGTSRRKLNLDREEEFAAGKGVHYCATCDAPLYKNKTIGVVGTGDSAVKGMNLAAQHADKIYNFTLADDYTAEPINLERLKPHLASKKVETFFETQVAELIGDNKLTAVKLQDGRVFNLDGVFVEIGAVPNVELAKQLGVELDDKGYIRVDNEMKTNIDGVFAIGDVTNFFGSFKQIITAAAMGAVAATSVFKHCR